MQQTTNSRFLTAMSAALLLLIGSGQASASEALTAEAKQAFVKQMQRDAKSAEDYIVGTFQDHDIVFLGEMHFVRQSLEMLQALIPKLHAAGVRNLGYEMLNAKEQEKLDRYVNGELDDSVADDLVFDWRLLGVAYREYADVLRAAREFNRGLPEGAQKFRILALDVPTHATEWSQLREGEKGDPNRKAMEHYLGGSWDDRRNELWAEIIARQVLHRGEKALVYAGAGHTNTLFFELRFGDPHHRVAGNLVYSYIRDRTMRILLHGTEPRQTSVIESLMAAYISAGGHSKVGFDVREGTVIGDLPALNKGYLPPSEKFGAARSSDFKFAHITEGYVFLAPRSEFKMVQPFGLTPQRVEEYNRRMQILTGDKNLSYSQAEVELKMQEEYTRRRASIERPNAPQ